MATLQPLVTGEQLEAGGTLGESKIYKMGVLSKRQRGVNHQNTTNLKFQDRWFILKQDALEYYEKEDDIRKPKV